MKIIGELREGTRDTGRWLTIKKGIVKFSI